MSGITFQAIINKISSLADGGWRITFECGQDSDEMIRELTKHRGGVLQLGVVPIPDGYAENTTETAE